MTADLPGARDLHLRRPPRRPRCATCRWRWHPASSCWWPEAPGPGSHRCCARSAAWCRTFTAGPSPGARPWRAWTRASTGRANWPRQSARCSRTRRRRWSPARFARSWPSASRTGGCRRPRWRVGWRRPRWRWPSTTCWTAPPPSCQAVSYSASRWAPRWPGVRASWCSTSPPRSLTRSPGTSSSACCGASMRTPTRRSFSPSTGWSVAWGRPTGSSRSPVGASCATRRRPSSWSGPAARLPICRRRARGCSHPWGSLRCLVSSAPAQRCEGPICSPRRSRMTIAGRRRAVPGGVLGGARRPARRRPHWPLTTSGTSCAPALRSCATSR